MPEQPWKVYVPIEVTEFGIVTEVRLAQPEKTPPPISVIEFGIVREVMPEQLEKA